MGDHADRWIVSAERVDGVGLFETAECAIELGIGDRPDLAAALSERDVRVIATDVVPRTVPSGIEFVQLDLHDPDPRPFRDAQVCYARRLPAELHRPAAALATRLGVPLYFTTLGFELPGLRVERHTTASTTWFRVGDPIST